MGVYAPGAPPVFPCRAERRVVILVSSILLSGHFPVPALFWRAAGEVDLGFGAGMAGLGCIILRGPGSGKGTVAHKGSPPLLSGGELGSWSRVA